MWRCKGFAEKLVPGALPAEEGGTSVGSGLDWGARAMKHDNHPGIVVEVVMVA